MAAIKHTLNIGGEDLPILIRKRPRARRMILRYQPARRAVSLTLPPSVSIRQGLRFAWEKRDWIARQMQQNPSSRALSHGQVIRVLGRDLRIVHVGGRGVARIEEGGLLIPGDPEFLARRARDWLIRAAREEIAALCDAKAKHLGRRYRKITLRDTASCWGSCTKAGNLSFSWRLVFAPPEILDYVVCHEMAHLLHLDHGAAFWRAVEQLCPDYQTHRAWLKKHGAALHGAG